MEDDHNRESEKDEIKSFIKSICTVIENLGIAKLWYEDEPNRLPSWLYNLRRIAYHTYVWAVAGSEIAALAFSDLTIREANYVTQMVVGHVSDYLIILMVLMYSQRIRGFLETFLKGTQVPGEHEYRRAAYVHCRRCCAALALTMAACLFFSNVDDIITFAKTGVPGGAIVTYWPTRDSKGGLAWVARCFCQLYWWFHVFMINFVKFLCLSALLTLAHKFKALLHYFENIRSSLLEKYEDPRTLDNELLKEYLQMFYKGTAVHAKLIECAGDLQASLGSMYNAVVLQSIYLLSLCLMKLVVQEFSVMFVFANGLFMLCMTTLIGLFMTAGGDVTHQAGLVSESIFLSGWDLVLGGARHGGGSGRRLRTPLVLALQISQRPVLMTAFGIFDLSYKNFITVLRCSYSFYAVSTQAK